MDYEDDGDLSPAGRHTFILLLIINFEIIGVCIGLIRRWFFL